MNVQPGQVYRDCDPRTGRSVTVERVDERFAYVKGVARSRVALHRFHADPARRTGFCLVPNAKETA